MPRHELHSIDDYENVGPSVNTAFNTGCVASCTVTSCSCTHPASYWSSTTFQLSPDEAWVVFFLDSYVTAGPKSGIGNVRAVRGGS